MLLFCEFFEDLIELFVTSLGDLLKKEVLLSLSYTLK